MPSAIPPRDVSLTWVRHLTCGATHPPTAPCPKLNTWLVAGIPATYLPPCTCPERDIDHADGCPRGRAIRRGWNAQMGRGATIDPPAEETA